MSPSKKTEIKRMMRAQPKPDCQLQFVLQDVEDPVNVGAIFRIADACKASIVLTGISARPPHKLISRVGRGKDQRVEWRYQEDIVEVLQASKENGFANWAVEITPQAHPYDRLSPPEKLCLVVGHEDHGVTKKALNHVDECVFIPMFGKGASLNVHVALAVVAFRNLSAATAV